MNIKDIIKEIPTLRYKEVIDDIEPTYILEEFFEVKTDDDGEIRLIIRHTTYSVVVCSEEHMMKYLRDFNAGRTVVGKKVPKRKKKNGLDKAIRSVQHDMQNSTFKAKLAIFKVVFSEQWIYTIYNINLQKKYNNIK